jgi:hypothetical protein
MPPVEPEFAKWWSMVESGAIIIVDSELSGFSLSFWSDDDDGEDGSDNADSAP